MKKVLLVLILMSIINVSALNITVDYPKEVYENEEFIIKIKTESIQLYDIKVDIFGEDKRISQIYNSKWKSTMYYLKMALKKEGEYKIKTSDFIGEANMTIKLRNYAGTITSFDGYRIKILENKKENEISNEEKKEEVNDSVESKQAYVEKEDKFLGEKEIINKNLQTMFSDKQSATGGQFAPDPIILNPKTIKTNENKEILGKGIAKYSFGIFCFILLLLYGLKTREKKNEFR